MRNDTSHREKGRAVFLSVIMVLSVVAMSAAFAGTAAAQDRSYDEETELYDASVIWQGQELEVTGLDADTDYDFRSVEDGLVDQVTSDGNGTVVLDTGDYEEGNYFLQGPGASGDDDENNFEIVDQGLDVTFDSDEVAQESDIAVGLEIDSIRSTYDVSVTEADDEFDADELEDIFGDVGANVTTDAEDDSITIEDADGDEWETQWHNISATGNYTFEFSVVDTAAEDTAEIQVVEEVVDRTFLDDPYEEEQAGIANFTVDMQGADYAVLQIGDFDVDEEQYYEVGVTINASEFDDDVVHIPMNLFTAGGWEMYDSVGMYVPEDQTFMSDELQDGVSVEVDYFQANAEPWIAEDGDPIEEEHIYVFQSMLQDGSFQMDLGDEWENISTTEDPDHGIDIVDAEMSNTADRTVLRLDSISAPGDYSQNVVPADEAVGSGMSQEDFEELTLSEIEDGDEVAVDFDGDYGDHVVGVMDDVGLAGAVYILNALVEQGVAEDFGNALHEADAGIEVTLEQEAATAIGEDVKATTNASLANDSDEWVQLPVEGLTTGDYEGDLHVSVPYLEVDEIGPGPAMLTVDYTEAAEGLDLPDDIELVEEFGVTFEAPSITIDDVAEVAHSADAEVTGETNVAPGHEVSGFANHDTWIAQGSGEVHEDGFTATFDTTEGQEGDTFNLEITQPGFGVSDELENVVLGDAPEGASFAVTAEAPDQVDVGADASLDVTVTNVGEQTGSADYTVMIDGEAVDEQTLEDWESGAEESFSYDFETDEEAEISWSVETDGHDDADGQSASGELTVGDDPEDPDAEPDDADADEEDDDDDVPGFGVAVAIVALLGAAMLALRRQD